MFYIVSQLFQSFLILLNRWKAIELALHSYQFVCPAIGPLQIISVSGDGFGAVPHDILRVINLHQDKKSIIYFIFILFPGIR